MEKMEVLRRHFFCRICQVLLAAARADITSPNRYSLLCAEAQTSSPGWRQADTLLLKVELSLAFSCLAFSVLKCRNRDLWFSRWMTSSWAFMLVLSGACRLRKISLPAPPCGQKRGPPCLIPTSLVSKENSSTAASSMATAKRQMLRSQTCLIRLASSVARCQFGENHQQCSGPSEGWLIWEDVAKRPLNPSMLIPSLLLIAG
ncbi:hypothetical protein HDV57DRAFT_437052 [Trichoderma longibrachiatum]